MNRLEKTENYETGQAAVYRYNGLGHRIGKKMEVPADVQLNPMQKIQREGLEPDREINYLIDMTRDYHNLLQENTNGQIKTYLWDGFAAGMIEEKESQDDRYYYLHDELGSPVRLSNQQGQAEEEYGYDEFGLVYIRAKEYSPLDIQGTQEMRQQTPILPRQDTYPQKEDLPEQTRSKDYSPCHRA